MNANARSQLGQREGEGAGTAPASSPLGTTTLCTSSGAWICPGGILQPLWSCVHPGKDPCTPGGGTQRHRLANRGIIQQDGKWFPTTSSQQRVWPARPDDTAGRRGWLLHGRACPSLFQGCCQALSRESEFHRLTGTLHRTSVIASLILSSTGGSAQAPAAALLRAAGQGDGAEMAAGCRAQRGNGKQGFPISSSRRIWRPLGHTHPATAPQGTQD